MADRSQIEWTDATWTPIRARRIATGKTGWHCEHASEGCRNCYAERQNRAMFGTGLAFKPGHLGRDVELFLDEAMLLRPLRWKKPRRIFACSMTDLFADFVPDAWIDRIFAVMALAPQHVFQVLTKRAGRMREYLTAAVEPDAGWLPGSKCYHGINDAGPWLLDQLAARNAALTEENWSRLEECRLIENGRHLPLPNVWLGVSVEDQANAEARIPDLLAAPAAVRFLSCEPLIGPLDLTAIAMEGTSSLGWDALNGAEIHKDDGDQRTSCAKIDWVIAGGESGPGARPMHPDWARALRDQCAAAGVPFFFKQFGEWRIADQSLGEPPRERHGDFWRIGKKAAGRLLDGIEHNGMPGAADG